MERLSKRVFFVSVGCIILLFIVIIQPLPLKADGPTLVQISPLNKTVSAGQTFSLDITCAPGQSIKSYELKIFFNPSLLHVNTVTEGTIFDGFTTFFNPGTINNAAGTITDVYGLIVGVGGVTNPGTLVSLSFTAQAASGSTTIGLYDIGITNDTAYVPITVTNGIVILREFTLTISLDGSGTVTKNPNQATYPYGTMVQLTAIANTGSVFNSWTGSLTGNTNPASITMNGNKSVTAHFTANQYSLTITTDGSGSVTKNPNQSTYSYGQVVTLTAVPGSGWVFSSWTGGLSGSQNPTTITMNGNKAVTAHFSTNQYTLTITTDGTGSVTKNPNQATYTYGQIVTLTAVPGTGWAFSAWTGDLTGSQNPKTITMDGNKAVTAHFTANPYALTITIDGSGSVTKNPNQVTYTYGQVVTLTAIPTARWSFSSWTGDLTGSQNPKTITMDGNKAVTAHFTANPYTLTITIDGSGSVTKNPNQVTYTYGQVVTLTAIPTTGWSFSSWTGDLTGNQNPKTITMNGNKAVAAQFFNAMAPQISNIARTTSNPLDTSPAYGWVNISCTVTDDVLVSQVLLRIHNPSGSWNNVSMTTKSSGKYYFRTTTAFSTAGNYSYSIRATDTNNNVNTTNNVLFSMPPNWDINLDGDCAIFDLVFISNHYNQSGANGWIREDADNNGEIQILDLVYVSNYFGTSWWG